MLIGAIRHLKTRSWLGLGFYATPRGTVPGTDYSRYGYFRSAAACGVEFYFWGRISILPRLFLSHHAAAKQPGSARNAAQVDRAIKGLARMPVQRGMRQHAATDTASPKRTQTIGLQNIVHI